MAKFYGCLFLMSIFNVTSKGPCRSSKTKGINIAINNEFLTKQGLVSLRDV
jgi:RNA-directed DNA polymerase